MKLEKRVKQRIDNNLDKITKNPYKKVHVFPLWAKIAIPVGSVALTAAVALGVILPLSHGQSLFPSHLQKHRLTTPRVAKKVLRSGS